MTPPSELAPAAMGELVDSIADYNNSANAIGFSVYYYIDQMYSKPGLRLLAVDSKRFLWLLWLVTSKVDRWVRGLMVRQQCCTCR